MAIPIRVTDPESVCVLTSGGADSAVLLAECAAHYARVYPLYIRAGLGWEASELTHLRTYLAAVAQPHIQPLAVLDLPLADMYGPHWSVTGDAVPDAASPDEAVYLPGRNLLLLAKAAVYCALRGVGVIAMGQLAANPFPDATPGFFDAMAAVSAGGMALSGLRVKAPFLTLTKAEVIARGRGLPLALSWSCIAPVGDGPGRHCGVCNKCHERRTAFAAAGISDPTEYAT